MTGTDVQIPDSGAVQVSAEELAETRQKFADLLCSGKSDAVSRFIRKPDAATEAGIVQGTVLNASQMQRFANGVAVGVYALLASGVRKSQRDLAAEIGVHETRISQLKDEGEIIARLGLPEGWKSAALPMTKIKSLTQGKGKADLREILTLTQDKGETPAKFAQRQRTKIAELSAARDAAHVQALADAAAAAKHRASQTAAEKEGKLGPAKTDTQSVPAPAPEVPAYGEKIEDALSSLRMAAAWLTGRVGDMTDAQREHCRSSLAPLADALYTARQNVAEQAPVAAPRKPRSRKST